MQHCGGNALNKQINSGWARKAEHQQQAQLSTANTQQQNENESATTAKTKACWEK